MGNKYKIAVLDFETDPFRAGRLPWPFAAGFYNGKEYIETWGPDAVDSMVEEIESLPDNYIIFAHNGGRFDFHFLFPNIDNPIRIISGRIVKTKFLERHILQDSYSIIPVPLHYGGQKLEIDYSIMEPGERDKPHNKKVIREYLQQDCFALYNFVSRFHDEFGRHLTVGGTAMKQMEQFHPFAKLPPSKDEIYRDWYMGGRVECFKPGIHKGPWKVYDRNSMYPTVMKECRHPFNGDFEITTGELPDDPEAVYFAEIEATSKGSLPIRTETGITFPHGRGMFKACSHEIRAAQHCGLLDIHDVKEVHRATLTTSFGEFVDYFYNKRNEYKAADDKIGEQFSKFMLNSCYGKFGSNPENFKDWYIAESNEIPDPALGWEIYSTCEYFDLYSRPAKFTDDAYYDVSIAASITSAARANLLMMLQQADTPLYCDTDSIICRGLNTGDVDDKRLGAWKLERYGKKKDITEIDEVIIAGKKLYSLYARGEYVKVTSKGGTLTGPQIKQIAKGDTIAYVNPAPVFSPSLKPMFITRHFRATGISWDNPDLLEE